MNSKISLFSLVLLIVSAIDSIRTLPTTAFFGASLVFFYLLFAIFFLIPVAFISAEFSSRHSDHGGIFYWIRHAFGDRTGLVAVWLQWVNTLVWYPTMLLFIAGTAAYLIDPALVHNKIYLLIFSLGIFWGLTFLNLRGIQVSARVNSVCGTIGTLIPMTFLIFLGIWWILSGKPTSISLSYGDLLPSLDVSDSSNIIVTIMASFLGMELAGVHIGDINNSQKNFPRAIGYSVLILLGTLIFGALAVAVVIPKHDIHFVDGVMQTFATFLNAFHAPYLIPVLAVLIIIGSSGGSVNWLLSPAKGLLQAAEHGFLPNYFLIKNRYGVSTRILVAQAIIVSIFCLAMQLVPSVNSYYWFLMALSTGLYMLMYVFLFLAALKLKRPTKGYKIPRGIRTISCLAGLSACVITLIVGFQPAPDAVIENKLNYALMITVGFGLMIAPVLFFWRYQSRQIERLIK